MDNKSCLAITIDVNHTSFLRLVVSDLCNYNIVELFSSYIFFLREVLSETLRGQEKKKLYNYHQAVLRICTFYSM